MGFISYLFIIASWSFSLSSDVFWVSPLQASDTVVYYNKKTIWYYIPFQGNELCCETAGCVICNLFAASVKFIVSHTVRNVSVLKSSIIFFPSLSIWFSQMIFINSLSYLSIIFYYRSIILYNFLLSFTSVIISNWKPVWTNKKMRKRKKHDFWKKT